VYVCVCIYIYVYTYIHTHTHTHIPRNQVYIHIYICAYRGHPTPETKDTTVLTALAEPKPCAPRRRLLPGASVSKTDPLHIQIRPMIYARDLLTYYSTPAPRPSRAPQTPRLTSPHQPPPDRKSHPSRALCVCVCVFAGLIKMHFHRVCMSGSVRVM